MAITYVDSTLSADASTSLQTASLSGAGITMQSGDKLLALVTVQCSGAGGSITPPAGEGWVSRAGGKQETTHYGVEYAQLFEKEWGAGDTDNDQSTFVIAGAGTIFTDVVSVDVWRGGNAGQSLIEDYGWNDAAFGVSSTLTAPTATSSGTNRVASRLYAQYTQETHSGQSEGTLAYQASVIVGFDETRSMAYASKGSGAVGTATIGSTSDDSWWALTLVLAATELAAPTQSPEHNSTGVATDTDLVLTFSENVQAGSGNITMRKQSDDSLVWQLASNDAAVDYSAAVVTITQPSELDASEKYWVDIDAGAFEGTVTSAPSPGYSDRQGWRFSCLSTPIRYWL